MRTGFKYIARIRGKNGKWKYIYKDTKAGSDGRNGSFRFGSDEQAASIRNRYELLSRDGKSSRSSADKAPSHWIRSAEARVNKLRGGKNSQSSYWKIIDRQPRSAESRVKKRST